LPESERKYRSPRKEGIVRGIAILCVHTYEKFLTFIDLHCELSVTIRTHPIRPREGNMHAQPGGSNHTNAYKDAVRGRSYPIYA